MLVGFCGLAVAAATQADTASSASMPVINQVEDRSVEALHRAIGAPGSIQRDSVVADLKTRIARGEVSPFKVLLSDALPEWKIANAGNAYGPNQILGGTLSLSSTSRGPTTFDDNFDSYPLSDDPVFDRFQVNMQDQINPSGEPWNFAQGWYIPSLFVAGQMDADEIGIFDPLPRWQGADILQNESIGFLLGDINGDGVVDTADLGSLIARFGTPRPGTPGPDQDAWDAADLNNDGVNIDTADLGILITAFGNTGSALTCLYTVDLTQSTDPDGIPLDGGTIAAGPTVTQTIAVENTGALANDIDANADGCPDCGFFSITTDDAPGDEKLYGDWTLTDAAYMGPADFKAELVLANCTGYGSEHVLADAREEAQISENACCFLGARSTFPLFQPTITVDLVMEVDCFYTTFDTFQWVDTTSSVEGFTVTRTFMGGYAPSLSPDFLKFSTNVDGFMNHFVFLGNLPGNFTIGQFYGTAPDVGLGAVGKEILTGEWFTLSYRMRTDGGSFFPISIWLRDSETSALVDPFPGDDGYGTVADGSDDIDDNGFAQIFPIGPYGRTPNPDGNAAENPQPALAAISMDTFRFLWAGDPTTMQNPGYAPNNIFYDNIHVEGALFPVPELPKFALKYFDDIETYFGGNALALQGGRWFDAQSSRALIDGGKSVAGGAQSIVQSNEVADGGFRSEFNTGLPLASATAEDWTLEVSVAVDNTTVQRTIRLNDNVVSQDPSTATVARLLLAVTDPMTGQVVFDPNPQTRVHMRVNNPNFDSNVEESPVDVGAQTNLVDSPNPRFINVPTNVFLTGAEAAGQTFVNYSFTVNAALDLVVKKNATTIVPDPVGAAALGYLDAGWSATSGSLSQLAFESGNQQFATGVQFWVDNVCLDGFGPVTADGPLYELAYDDDFELYPNNTPIDGQGDTPFVDGASLVDTNLCIEQGLQALDLTASNNDTWCTYMIKNDAIGGIDPVNDWTLADGDTIYVRQADCGGAVACKDLQCFTNPNRPDEFFPNVGFFDDPDTGTKAAIGARVTLTGTFTGDPVVDLTANPCAVFDWNTYDPLNLFCKYEVNSLEVINTPSLGANTDYYNVIGGKIIVGSIIAVDQIFDTDLETGLTACPGLIDQENLFKIVDPCESEIRTGTWTYLGDGASVDTAVALECTDVPHFNFVFDGFPRYQGGGINVVDDPAGAGFGQVLKAINLAGFNADGGSLFIDLRSDYPDAFALVGGPDCVFEVDCYITDNKSRYTIDVSGPNGAVTQIGLGGPDKDFVLAIGSGSPGGIPVPSTNFSLEERNPGFGGPFGMGPQNWFWDTGVAIPLNAWFRLQLTVVSTGAATNTYAVAMDASGTPGGDGAYETVLSTLNGAPVHGGNTNSGKTVTATANSIDGFDTNTGLDEGGTGTFLRDPITSKQDDVGLPDIPTNTFPDDFCFYIIDAVDGETLGVPPAPCMGVFASLDVLGLLRDETFLNWPDGGNFDVCPVSQGFIWQDAAETGACTGDWTWVDPDDDTTSPDFPAVPGDVQSWANYVTIPAFSNPGEPSSWYFDNVHLDGSATE
jgi:hypothetical protein